MSDSLRIVKITIPIMRESGKGLSYWVYLHRADGGKLSPYMSYSMDHAIYTAAEYGNFLGIEVENIEPHPSLPELTPELIEAGYKKAELVLSTLEYKDWTKY